MVGPVSPYRADGQKRLLPLVGNWVGQARDRQLLDC